MIVEIPVPHVGESVQEATLVQWFKKNGAQIEKDDPLFAIETDKVTLEVVATAAGVLSIKIAEGETVAIGTIACTIDTQGAPAEKPPPKAAKEPPETASPTPAIPSAAPAAEPIQAPGVPEKTTRAADTPLLSPAVRHLVAEKRIDISKVQGTGPAGRITKGDVILYIEQAAGPGDAASRTLPEHAATPLAETSRKPMSRIRKRIAERLVAAKQNTAMLTTFNEIDMSRVMALRTLYKDEFNDKHGVRLGFMSFFIKASSAALKAFPEINAFIDGEDIVYHHHVHMGVAVGSERGLVVPVIPYAETLSFAQLEKKIIESVTKIKNNQLALSDLEGGTFTITNGGVYGSLLSTPILNLPQSGILGLHKIEKRPVVIEDSIVIRPMMYVALSYDHRIVDGQGAVRFLKRIKSDIEEPERLLLEV
ncbi:MAG: 2-oxoglutarate dehydrogenase complex dihydrolipoyllysine-residue succinyltransferase [Desulfobacterales bacterium]|jgi:2-oxoglutarate dehydrogenase E2 component (dihydrolipoamide succinyltransferase)|nr:2-oxoglutarate dehydrogenase complex dihydrolipoyllysine-residue succinyltransferase [Desulfobacterales bacterium]